MNKAKWGMSLAFAIFATVLSIPVLAANTAVANARVLVPDGSSIKQTIAGGETRWFVFGAEPGKTYAVEVIDHESDLPSNTIGAVDLFDSTGSAAPPETNINCAMSTRPPELGLTSDGVRCVVRTFLPATGNLENKRGIFIAVSAVSGPQFQIRVRESTIYGRWTTNGYDFHVEMQNTTADAVCAQLALLPNSGNTYTGGQWSGGVFSTTLTIPAFGANKVVVPNGTLVGAANDNKGTLRIGACPPLSGAQNFVPGALHVSTYAFNPLTNQFLYFFVNTTNNGSTSNSW